MTIQPYLKNPTRALRLSEVVSYHVLFILIVSINSACGTYYPTHDQNEDQITSELTQPDLKSMFDRMSLALQESSLMQLWGAYHLQGQSIKIGVLATENLVKPSVTSSLTLLMKSLHDELRADGVVSTVDRTSQPELIQNIRDTKDPALNRQKVAQLGAQLDVQYLMIGRLYSVSDRQGEDERIQYFLFMQVIETKTGAVRWQMELETLKGG